MNLASDAVSEYPGRRERLVGRGLRNFALRGAIGGLAALGTCGLFARIMMFPLRHDEQAYLPVSALFATKSLYHDLSFNHLPNLPIMLSTLFAMGGEWRLLIGRLAVFGAWLATAGVLAWLGWRCARDVAVAALSVLLVATNVTFLGPAGMIVTNNLAPVPFALLALAFFSPACKPRRAGRS